MKSLQLLALILLNHTLYSAEARTILLRPDGYLPCVVVRPEGRPPREARQSHANGRVEVVYHVKLLVMTDPMSIALQEQQSTALEVLEENVGTPMLTKPKKTSLSQLLRLRLMGKKAQGQTGYQTVKSVK